MDNSSYIAPRVPFGLFLALRYLKPRRTFVSIITLISVLGVTLGIAVLIVVISVMTGFDLELRKKVLGFDPHLTIKNQSILENWREVRAEVEKTPGVDAVSPYVMGPVLAEFQGQLQAPIMRGIDPALEAKVTDLKALMAAKDKDGNPREGVAGEFNLDGDSVVVGAEFAASMHLHVGDKLTVYSTNGLEQLAKELHKFDETGANKQNIAELQEMINPKQLTVTGIFSSGRYAYDSQFIFVPLYIGQELYELGDGVHGLAAHTLDPNRAEEVKTRLNDKLEPPLYTRTWIDQNAQFFDAVRTERSTMFIILFVVLIVAGFCVMNTLITVTVQKTREIGIMKAVGADVWQIVRVFMAQGIVVGVFGMVSGVAAGLGILALRNPFKHWLETALHVEIFPRAVYQFTEIPSQTDPAYVALVCLGAFLICSLAALIPAYFAARLDPVKALRFE